MTDADQPRRRAYALCGLVLYRTTRTVAGSALYAAGRLLGLVSWARRETAHGLSLVVKVCGVVVWQTLEAARGRERVTQPALPPRNFRG